ncbi:hypothetical protein BGZ68_007355 [Mortierella alpina]|nr:hypothetical protein BGZ68_007355 [Mortierella alpina]
MSLTRSRSSTDLSPRIQARSVQDSSWLTVEQEHDFNDALSTFTHVLQDKTEDEDTIEIHAPYFDGQDEEEDEDNAMIEDQDMMESVAPIDTETVISRNPTPPPPPPSPPAVPVVSNTATGSSFSTSRTQGDSHCGMKRTWIDRGHQANTQETDRSEIMTKRYRAYKGANDHYSRPYKRYPHNGRWTSNTHSGGDQPVPNENGENSGGFKEQVEDLRQLINAVSVGSDASYPRSINTANSQTSDPGSVHTPDTGDCGRRRSSPAAGMAPSRPHAFPSRRFSHPHHRSSSTVVGEQPLPTGGFNSGVRGSGNTASFTPREAPFGPSPCSCSNPVDYSTITPETLLQLALSELNSLITRHDEEKAAHSQTKNGLHFVESRLMDAYERIQFLTEDYDHVLRRCRRAERSLLLTHSDYDDYDDDDNDDDGYYDADDDEKERSSQSGRRRYYYRRDMSRGRSRGRSRSDSLGRSRDRGTSKHRGRSKRRSQSTFSHRSRSTYSHKSHYKNRTKSTYRYRNTKY